MKKYLDIMMSPPDEVNIRFQDNKPFVEIKDKKKRYYFIRFFNKDTNELHYQTELQSDCWAESTEKEVTNWLIRIWGITDFYHLEYNLLRNPINKRMIVIVTHSPAKLMSGGKLIKDLLSDIRSFSIPNNEVCVVDNNSTDKVAVEYIESLKKEGYNVIFNPAPSSTYQTGAYNLALDAFKSEAWFFLQDSIRIKQNIFEMIPPKLTNNNVYTFLTFYIPHLVYQPGTYRFLFENFQTVRYKHGLVGSMFFARDEVVRKIRNDWPVTITNVDNQAMEIGFGLIFDKYGIEVVGLDVVDEREGEWHYKGRYTAYPFFDKIAMASIGNRD